MISGSLFSQNRLALIDGNSFYASCEMVTRPELRGCPVGVLSNNDGCFVSASKELKKLGIKTGTPYFEVKKLCKEHRAHVFSANFNNYTYLSKLMFKAMWLHAPDVEVYSIDEGFVDISIIPKKDLLAFGMKVKNEIFKHSRIPVGIGIAPTKGLAKIANKWAKSNPMYNHIYEINEINLDWTLENTPVENLWGIGRASGAKLRKLGIFNAKQFKDYPYIGKIQELLTINGRKPQLELQGIQCYRLHEQREKKKEISHSRTYGARTNDIKILKESLATYATLAAEELRKEGSVCKEVRLYVRTDTFKEDLPQYVNSSKLTLPAYTLDTMKIIEAVWELLQKAYHPYFEYRKVGVTLSSFQDFEAHQISLFGNDDTPERIELMKRIDLINGRYGDDAIRSDLVEQTMATGNLKG